jgi:hypothetical protein
LINNIIRSCLLAPPFAFNKTQLGGPRVFDEGLAPAWMVPKSFQKKLMGQIVSSRHGNFAPFWQFGTIAQARRFSSRMLCWKYSM